MKFEVHGWVQGVGYRAFVHRAAYSLGVRGQVWNRPDGVVEGIAQHTDADELNRFIEHLETGPGSVEHIETEAANPHRTFTEFTIEPTHFS